MSTIKFEKGKFYKTRSGDKAECVHTNVFDYEPDPTPILFVIDGGDYFATDYSGRFCTSWGEDDHDIISEWVEERVVWVVWSGWSRSAFVYDLYSEAFRFFTALSEHPASSITRVVIQDGHVDTE